MMRKIAIAWSPAAPMEALLTLVGARHRPRAGASLVHDELRRELRRALASQEATLARFAACAAWLERRGHASMGRAAHGADGVAATALRAGELHVDLAALDAAAQDESRGLDGKAHASLFALRAVLRALHRADLFAVTSTRVGTRRAELDDVLREVERAAKRHGFRDEASVPARFAPPAAAPEPAPSPAPAQPRTASPKRAAPKRAPTGFGGLPDDAVSDAPPPPPPPPDPHAPGPDALFFLHAAGIEGWPCARAALDRARRAVITRLHPDRAGDDKAHDFHRAIKGHAELTALLALLDAREAPAEAPAAAPPPPPTARPKRERARARRPSAPTPPPAPAPSTCQEWPPPPPAPPPTPPRAVSLDDDARYFLHESSVAWPCPPDALRGAWQALSTRLRRMTPASAAATSFARASRGYTALLRAAGAAA